MFASTTYTERRKRLRNVVPDGLILLPGNEESSMNYKDNTFHFRQDSCFLYFFGLDQPGLVGVIDEQGQAILFGKDPTIEQVIWTGNLPSMAENGELAGITQTKPIEQLDDYLSGHKKIHFLPPYRSGHLLMYSKWLSIPLDEVEAHHSLELIKAIVALREIKTDEEIEEIEKAVNTSVDMHTAAMRHARPGMTESEVVGLVHGTAIASGGNIAFPIIGTVCGNILHNHYYGNTLQEGQLFLCDSGAETAMHYAADLTRTFPVGTQFSSRQKELYMVVYDAHMAAIRALKPGVLFKDIYLLASTQLAKGLIEIGLMKGDPAEAVAVGAHTLFFQCGLGHMIGLDVHDMENLGEKYVGYTEKLQKSTEFGMRSLRLGKRLEERFVVAVEPGIYIIPELIDLWEKEKKFDPFINYSKLQSYRDFGGIRIEDDFLITPGGSRLLGKPLARSVDEIERLRQL